MPGPTPRLLQLGHDNAVVDLVPTVHDQMAGHGIHGIELAAGVGGTQYRLVIRASSNRCLLYTSDAADDSALV